MSITKANNIRPIF